MSVTIPLTRQSGLFTKLLLLGSDMADCPLWRGAVRLTTKSNHRVLVQSSPGVQAPGSTYKGGSRPLRARFTGLWAVSPTLGRRVEVAQGVTTVYESLMV